MNPEFHNLTTCHSTWKSLFLLVVCCLLLGSCRGRSTDAGPSIEFTSVPLAEEGGPDKLDIIEGRVVGAQRQLQVVLFARSGAWYVQPYADQPFTAIQADARWRSTTHLGTEYAALLVEPGYQPPRAVEVLPEVGGGVMARIVARGEPVFWQRWWFLILCILACMSALLAAYSYRLHQATRQLHLRFEERLAERTQVAQELHDTLLQGVISASMQLHMAVDRLPEDLPAKPSLAHVLQVMGQVLEDGRTALQRLRSSETKSPLDVEQAFSKIPQEFAAREETDFRVTVKGHPRPVHPVIRDEVYRIGREAVVNAFRHGQTRHIEVEVDYQGRQLRVVVCDDGRGNAAAPDPVKDDELSSMRARAERIGARLRLQTPAEGGTRIELSVPGPIAYPGRQSNNPLRWRLR